MWGLTLIIFSCGVMVQVASHDIKVDCQEYDDAPPRSNTSPSMLKALKVELITENGQNWFNVSWAINIDSSNKYLTGTLIDTSWAPYFCTYDPPLATANLAGFNQVWFHHAIPALSMRSDVQASNVPWPPSGSGIVTLVTKPVIPPAVKRLPAPDDTWMHKTSEARATEIATPGLDKVDKVHKAENEKGFAVTLEATLGALAVSLILISCCIALSSFCPKICGTHFAALLGFKMLPTSPVSVLLVYPAENLMFQRAVVALAEFLQLHCGCSVAVDMWQQGKIAELGPVRWLAEQTKAADRVLIVCPQPSVAPSAPSHPDDDLPAPSIPAAASDLYALILNTAASHSKSSRDLAKFWVVQLGKRGNLPAEVRSCKSFCLTKDLRKLCRSLHSQGKDGNKMKPFLVSGPRIFYEENSTVKLRGAVESLAGHKQGTSREMEPLKSVVVTI